MPNIKLFIPVVTLGLIVTAVSCKKQQKQGGAYGPASVNAYTVHSEKVTYYDTYPGTVVALNQVELHSQVNGYVTGIFFKEGDHVKKGQKLYEIDRSIYQASYEQAKAGVDIAEANLEKAQRDVDRYINLSKQDAIAQQTLDDANTSLRNANLQLVSAKANLLKARTDLSFSVITAPFSGIIGISSVKPGTYINTGQTVLNTISTDDPMAADLQIDEKSISRFVGLLNKTALQNDSTFRIVLPDNSVYPEFGKIYAIDRAIDPQTGTIKVRLTFPNRSGYLRVGMSCLVKVLNTNSGMQVVIPYKAVTEQMSEYFVFLIKDGKAHQTKIKLGPNLGENIVVKKGLMDGDKIVLNGIQNLRDGTPVQISDTTMNKRP